MLAATVLLCCVLVSLVAVWTDVKHREVPHWIVGALVALWAVAAVVAPEALGAAPLTGLVCGATALAVGFFLHALGWLGGGDGKLLAALALWLGPADLGFALLATGLIGLVLALPALLRRPASFRDRGIPYACAIAPPAAAILAVRAVAG
ncbi:MAG: prepilin peptidase [Gammaproteobacteria bacterium]|nr:prepilin peptidase [Gammaproteobacteria bacterium]